MTSVKVTHPFFIFYIGHIIDPFLLYCLTTNALFSIGVAVLWEILEYGLFSIFGNYSPLFLEGFNNEDGELESLTDILIYDIGGAIVAVAYAHVLYNAIGAERRARLRVSWGTIVDFVPLVAKVLVLSPLAALGWECAAVVQSWCQSNGYLLFPWGMLAIVPLNTVFILYYFEAGSERWWIVGSAWLLFLTAFQRVVPGAFLALLLFTFLTIMLWLYLLFQKNRENYKRLDLAGA